MAPSTQRKHLLDEDNIESDEAVKRLRGGGYGYDDSEELFDEDVFEEMDMIMDGPPDGYEEGVTTNQKDDGGDGDIAFGDITDAHRARWERPAVPESVWKTHENDLNLQWLDIDMIGGVPLEKNPNADKKNIVGAESGSVPIIRLYGVNETGNSVAVFIHGFTAYGYFALPKGYKVDDSNDNLGQIRRIIDENLRAKLGNQYSKANAGKDGNASSDVCLAVLPVKDKQSIMGYDPSHNAFLKVYVGMPTMIPRLKTIMEDGIVLPGITNENGGEVRESVMFQPFECNVPYVLRYMIDQDVTGASWLSLPKGTYKLRKSENEKGTHCQVCMDFIIWNAVISFGLLD